jgi:hypothetical protein
MNATVLMIIQFAIQYGLPAAEQIVALLHQTTDPTPDQWAALFATAKTPLYQGSKTAPAPAP